MVVELPSARPAAESVLLRWFVDDFQVPVCGGHYRVEIDGERMQAMALGRNAHEQTGPDYCTRLANTMAQPVTQPENGLAAIHTRWQLG